MTVLLSEKPKLGFPSKSQMQGSSYTSNMLDDERIANGLSSFTLSVVAGSRCSASWLRGSHPTSQYLGWSPSSSFWLQLPARKPSRQQMMAQVAESLPPSWESWIRPRLQDQPAPVPATAKHLQTKPVHGDAISVSLSPSPLSFPSTTVN